MILFRAGIKPALFLCCFTNNDTSEVTFTKTRRKQAGARIQPFPESPAVIAGEQCTVVTG